MAKLTLDARLIDVAQKSISYIELHTPVNRTAFGKILLTLNILMSIPIFIWTVTGTIFISIAISDENTTDAIICLILITPPLGTFISQMGTCFTLWKNLKKKISTDALPQEITTRRRDRLISLFSLFYFSIFFVWVVTFRHTNDGLSVIVASAFMFLITCFCILTMIEYFYCTTLLPPGEKERGRTERATKNAVPSLG